jgi:hypothetical protein
MNSTKKVQSRELQPHLPSLENIQQELGKAKSIDRTMRRGGKPT